MTIEKKTKSLKVCTDLSNLKTVNKTNFCENNNKSFNKLLIRRYCLQFMFYVLLLYFMFICSMPCSYLLFHGLFFHSMFSCYIPCSYILFHFFVFYSWCSFSISCYYVLFHVRIFYSMFFCSILCKILRHCV